MHKITQKSDVEILRWSFSEAQTGKSACDRQAALIKKRIANYVDQGNNLKTEADFYKALLDPDAPFQSALGHTTVIHAKKSTTSASTKASGKRMNGIRSLSDFTFFGDKLIARKFGGFGTGQEHRYADYKIPEIVQLEIVQSTQMARSSLETTKHNIIAAGSHVWNIPITRRISRSRPNQLFDCPGIKFLKN